jgi:hypothetical protein
MALIDVSNIRRKAKGDERGSSLLTEVSAAKPAEELWRQKQDA